MSIEENKKIAKEFTERWGQGDDSVLDELATDDFILHTLGGEGMDIAKIC